MAGKFQLDGSMIPRTVKRMFDQRGEERCQPESGHAVMTARGQNHLVPIVNVSAHGAMLRVATMLHIGETISLQMLDRGAIQGQVRWVRDGRIGVSFNKPLE